MDYHLILEFRERLIERYDATELTEILGLTVEDLWEYFAERMLDNEELVQETGLRDLEDERHEP